MRRLAYRVLAVFLMLLALWVTVSLLDATARLPVSLVALPRWVNPLLRHLTILFGLVGAGGYMLATSSNPRSSQIMVWAVGLGLSAIFGAAFLVTGRAVFDYAALHLGWTLSMIGLAFWLMQRFSNIHKRWANTGTLNVAAQMAVVGIRLVASRVMEFPGFWVALATSFLVLIFAAHSYRALRDPNAVATLASHWYGFAVVLVILGVGLVGSLNATPSIANTTRGTHADEVQVLLTTWAVIAVVLAVTNQAAAELRGVNRRVTGLTALWLVSFGVLGVALAMGCAASVQAFADVSVDDLVPLYGFAVAGWCSVAVGVGVYGLQFWLRRPQVKSEEKT